MKEIANRLLLVPCLLAITACRTMTARPVPDRPNFVLIFLDDLGYGDLGCYGSPVIDTPNIDRLCAEGMRFTDFYSASPVCSASRAGLLTGCYPPRVGVKGVYFPDHVTGLHPDERTLAEVLRGAGYATACIGKWHLGHLPPFLPTEQGFDSYFGVPYSNDMDPVEGADRGRDRAWVEKDYTSWNVPLMEGAEIVERPAVQSTLTQRYTERAQQFLREHQDEPFFLYLAHTMPHIPLFVTDEFHDSDPTRAYERTIEEIDHFVGELLATLRRLDLDEDTLVLFTSDNGPWLSMKHHGGSHGPLREGKFSTWEGGMRVPAIARWPREISPGSVCHEVCATIDVLPTFAALAGAELPNDRVIDGLDIFPLLAGGSTAPLSDRWYCYYKGDRLECVRHGRYKLRRTGKKEGVKNALYDLSWDFAEEKDIAKEQPEVVEFMGAALERMQESLRANARPEGRVEPEATR